MSLDTDAMFDQVKDEYLAPILAEIRQKAETEAGGGPLRPTHVYRAFEGHFAGLQRPRGAVAFVQDNIFLLTAVFLTIVFGAFGLYHPEGDEVSGFLDICKIFAGAVVGGAAAQTVGAIKSD